MKAGDLRHRITIQQLTQTRSTTDRSVVKTYTTFAEVFAYVETLSGRKFWATRAVNSETTHEITIRYRAGILPTMRVLWEGQTLEIQEVKPDPRKTWIYMTAKEVLNTDVPPALAPAGGA